MKNILSLLLIALSLSTTAQKRTDIQKDLNSLPGKWEGQLIYTDYKDDTTSVTLPATVDITGSGTAFDINYSYTEPNGKLMTNKGELRFSLDSSLAYYDGKEYLLLAIHRRGIRLSIVMTREGEDNERNAEIRQTFTMSPNTLNILKEVKYDGMNKFFVRNRLSITKK